MYVDRLDHEAKKPPKTKNIISEIRRASKAVSPINKLENKSDYIFASFMADESAESE